MSDLNEGEDNVYIDESREEYMDSDSISSKEEGFMKGYDEADTNEEEKKKEEEENNKEQTEEEQE